jgi:hypothetical protein
MPDDCPVNDESRRALRNLARQAEWPGRPGPAGAALDARTLRDLGRELDLVLARDPEPEPDQATWAHRASRSLAAYCQRAQPDWTVEQIAQLARLREDAMTALAPGPGEPQADAEPEPSRRPLPFALNLGSRRPAVLALAAVCCLVLIALVFTLPHLLSGNSAQTSAASSATTVPATAPTQLLTSPVAPTATDSATDTSPTTTSTPASAGAPATAASTPAADDSSVTAIHFSNPPDAEPGIPPDTSPKVIVTVNVTASGTGDITITFAITGSSGQPQTVQQSESGDTSYSDVTQTIPLSQWCGQSSVRLTVSSGAVSQSTTVPVSGC